MISLTGVTKSYSTQPGVLQDVHLNIEAGDFLYVVGSTGAGKTSLLKLLATEDKPTQGVVSVFGYPTHQLAPSALSSVRQSTGYIPQRSQLIPDLTLEENLLLARSFSRHASQSKSEMYELLERLGLITKRNKKVSSLSGGETQRAQLACALVRQPELILADEPTGAQDRDFTWVVMDLLVRAHKNGATVIVATHDVEIVRRVRKKCAHLKDGKLFLEDGTWVY